MVFVLAVMVHAPIGLRSVLLEWGGWRGASRDWFLVAVAMLLGALGMRAVLGVFDVNTFFPEKDRTGLAMRLNSMLASPSFQNWVQGEPLDVAALLYTPDGRPRHSIFYIAHLSEEERMFFVTLLYANIESWMRAQSGTSSLRALVYFDEIFGYLPPIGNPPSKTIMLRMLKQARAFGVGMVLATQNPVDVDYKGLSNMGTWFIGKLATDQDKAGFDGSPAPTAASTSRSLTGSSPSASASSWCATTSGAAVPDTLGDELPGRAAARAQIPASTP
jgi:hypothetical protein